MLTLWVKWYGWEINIPKSIIGSSFAATLWFSALFILEIPLVPIILRSSMRQVKRDWGLGHCAVTHYPMYQYLVGHIFILFFLLFQCDTWNWELLIFYCCSSVLVVLFCALPLLTSVSSFFEFFGAVCLYISCVIFFGTREISLSLHCVFRGRGVTVFLSFRGFRFSRCRAGEWANDKIPYHGERLHLSLWDTCIPLSWSRS